LLPATLDRPETLHEGALPSFADLPHFAAGDLPAYRKIEKRGFARQDVAAYTALRNWSSQLYEAPAEQGVISLVEDTSVVL
jgi:hypothetical protein